MMKNFITIAALAAGANALVGRSDSCCFHLTASGGASGEVGQLSDGQNRIGDNSLSPAQFCIDSQGAITDSNGRGCILTPPTTQLQCDEGASPTPGFSVNSQGQLEFQGSTSFVACATGQNGGLNIYTTPNQSDVTGCVNVELSADTCSSSGPGPGASSSSVPSPSAPVSSTPVPESTPATTGPAASGPSGGAGSSSSVPTPSGGPQPSESTTPAPSGGGASPQPSESATPAPSGGGASPQPSESATPSGGGASPQPSESATPAPSGGGASPQPSESATPAPSGGGASPQPSESAAPPAPSGGGTPQPSESPLPGPPVTVVSTVTVTDCSCPATSPAGGGGVAPSGGGGVSPSGSGSASVPASSATSTPATGTSGSSCPPTLTKGSFESPHLIIPVDSSSPDTAPGTSFNGTVSSTISSAFNFDIPSSDAGKTCSLVFLFPELKDLETSSFTFSGDGKIDFAKLSAPADKSTSFNTMPSVSQDLGDITVSPGNTFVVSTFSCPAGETIAFEMKSSGNTELNFFEDWNPSPIGLFITTC